MNIIYGFVLLWVITSTIFIMGDHSRIEQVCTWTFRLIFYLIGCAFMGLVAYIALLGLRGFVQFLIRS